MVEYIFNAKVIEYENVTENENENSNYIQINKLN